MSNLKRTSRIILQIFFGIVLLGLILLTIRLRSASETASPAMQGAYPGLGETDSGDALLFTGTEAPYPPPGQEATQMVENNKPKPPPCEFTSENPEPQIPDEGLIDFQFSEPRIIFSNISGIGIADWLLDGERLLIAENNQNGKEIIKTINIRTGESVTFGERIGSGGKPVWLEKLNAVAYVSLEQDHTELLLSYADQKETQWIASGVSGWSLAGNDNGLVFFTMETGDIPQIWLVDSLSIQEVSGDLAQWEYQRFEGISTSTTPGRTFATALQPHGYTMAFYGNGYFFLVDETGYTCEVDLGSMHGIPISVLNARWSDDGKKLALIATAQIPGKITPFSKLLILDHVTGKVDQVPIPAPIIYDVAWNSNNRHLAALGADENEIKKGKSQSIIYLVDINYPDVIFPISASLFGGGAGEGWQLAWSPRGDKLAVKCPEWSTIEPLILQDHICIFEINMK